MPSVLLGNVAYGTNDPKLVKWIWIGRNCKYLMGMPLDFHGWGDFSNRAVSLVGTLETRPVELLQERVAHMGMRCASQGRSHSHLGWISSHCCADSCVSCCLDWPLASCSSPVSVCTLGLTVTCVVWPESAGAVAPEKTPAPWVVVWVIRAVMFFFFNVRV